ncbi:YhfZ family protein [Streptomyces sp. NBC_01237]|uniref:YhfZ family protein n=1 Tax=Streptomyces sp. NBC_01237 TaxID=2903790 RepID=UPI002DDA1974|nr:YhfZ family protein [Streptomyces sp. NBC_01237]WRZ76541.1 GntR family transcriptional regulator [Streptomyces sp. NBC_01237]
MAQTLALFLLRRNEGDRIGRIRDYAGRLKCGNGTVQAAFSLLEECGAIETEARGHLGTYLVRADISLLWKVAGLGAVTAAMPMPSGLQSEGLATGLRRAFQQSGIPLNLTFIQGSHSRVNALVDRRLDLIAMSRLAFDRSSQELPIKLMGDLGTQTYTGKYCILLRRDASLDSTGLRVAIDPRSMDQEVICRQVFARKRVEYIYASYPLMNKLFERGDLDATVWHGEDAPRRFSRDLKVFPVSRDIMDDLPKELSRAALAVYQQNSEPVSAVCHRISLDWIIKSQAEVISGQLVPSY